MKLSVILAALGTIPFAAANGPYDDSFNKYCGDDKTQGSLTVGGKTYNYRCNTTQGQHDGWFSFKVDTVDKCVDICSQNQDKCNSPVWNKDDGRCWIGKIKGGAAEWAGRITLDISNDSNGSQTGCSEDLKKWAPQDPVCSKSDMKPVEANGKKFMLTCKHDIYGNKVQSGSFPEIKDCLKACGSKSDCTYATHRASDKKCWLGTVNPLDKKIEANGHLNSAIVIH